jgi:hypothetical protein
VTPAVVDGLLLSPETQTILLESAEIHIPKEVDELELKEVRHPKGDRIP